MPRGPWPTWGPVGDKLIVDFYASRPWLRRPRAEQILKEEKEKEDGR